ncbi:hypothetical protein [Aquirufa novilacunae]|uniref:Gfo/Idh/MocA family oxidoreductase n=1 Tax=Aquirufa novilacunae TaxID=3139305 RepID=A0ABW8U1W1_9BACT
MAIGFIGLGHFATKSRGHRCFAARLVTTLSFSRPSDLIVTTSLSPEDSV